ncbi:MAG: hypothetical protein GX051_03850 [Clostridiales bacterium]|nr:hypothetical protein [Clostridiales bacterium]
MNVVCVDFSKSNGKIKPVHGVCNGPICNSGVTDLSKYYREIGVPSVRLHDTDGANSRFYVDVSRIFPNFDADEQNPSNYFFERTDRLLKSIQALNSEIIYRLGESIDHDIGARYAAPPKDFDKWVRIVLQIIRHYNNGWANGFNMNIRRWEIWNEAEGINERGIRCNWRGGTFEQVMDLYARAAIAIKAENPDYLIGGLAFCGVSESVAEFISFCCDKKLPLDFLSYHGYLNSVKEVTEPAFRCRELLDNAGFTKVEIIFDEWNYIGFERKIEGDIWKILRSDDTVDLCKEAFDNQGNEVGAAFDAAALIAMNSCPVDIANYYDAQMISRFCGLFDRYACPLKPYYSFCAYGELFRASSNAAQVETEGDGIYALAGTGDKQNTVLISSFRGDEGTVELRMNGLGGHPYKAEIFILDKEHNLSPEKTEYYSADKVTQFLELSRYSVAMIKITRAE